MRKRNYISSEEFALKYDVAANHIHVFKNDLKGEIPKGLFYYENKKKMYIDEEFFLRRKIFQHKIWLEAHDYYYFFSEQVSDYAMAKIVAKYYDEKVANWSNYIHDYLFSYLQSSIFKYKVSKVLWKFYRAMKSIYREMHLKKGIKSPKPPSFYLDKRSKCA